jgi:beta-lactamase superfamily II metal-dependent hydrolase
MVRNKSWTAEALEQEKKKHGPLSEAMKSMLDMIRTYTGGPVTPAPEFPRVRYRVFSNNRGDGFDDTNNCSLVTFLSVDSLKLIIPGDIEKPGLEALLKKEEFRSELSDVSVFIAPHHGRDSGYHPDVFKYCTPDFVIISDSEVKYATQEMTNTYGSKARGIQFNGETRSVLSTRKDGSLQWDL